MLISPTSTSTASQYAFADPLLHGDREIGGWVERLAGLDPDRRWLQSVLLMARRERAASCSNPAASDQ